MLVFTIVILIFGLVILLIEDRMIAAERKEQKSDKQKSKEKRDQLFLEVRNLFFGDQNTNILDKELQFYKTQDIVIKDAVELIEKGCFNAAQARLQSCNFQKLSQKIGYWLTFAKVKLKFGEKKEAQKAFLKILEIPGIETRIHIQTWNILRSLGYKPDKEVANSVLGVIVEMTWDEDSSVVAAYADGYARVFWSNGTGMMGDEKTYPEVAKAARQVVSAANKVVASLPVKSAHPLPERGKVGFTFLTPCGMHIVDEKEPELANEGHRLYEVHNAVHDLVSHFMQISSTMDMQLRL